jgi:hypothetical protein
LIEHLAAKTRIPISPIDTVSIKSSRKAQNLRQGDGPKDKRVRTDLGIGLCETLKSR